MELFYKIFTLPDTRFAHVTGYTDRKIEGILGNGLIDPPLKNFNFQEEKTPSTIFLISEPSLFPEQKDWSELDTYSSHRGNFPTRSIVIMTARNPVVPNNMILVNNKLSMNRFSEEDYSQDVMSQVETYKLASRIAKGGYYISMNGHGAVSFEQMHLQFSPVISKDPYCFIDELDPEKVFEINEDDIVRLNKLMNSYWRKGIFYSLLILPNNKASLVTRKFPEYLHENLINLGLGNLINEPMSSNFIINNFPEFSNTSLEDLNKLFIGKWAYSKHRDKLMLTSFFLSIAMYGAGGTEVILALNSDGYINKNSKFVGTNFNFYKPIPVRDYIDY
jgi:hypothetical protein